MGTREGLPGMTGPDYTAIAAALMTGERIGRDAIARIDSDRNAILNGILSALQADGRNLPPSAALHGFCRLVQKRLDVERIAR